MKARIALLFGGDSAEHDVSVMGYGYVKKLLDGKKFDVLPVYVSKDGSWYLGGEGGKRAYLSGYLGGSLYTDDGFTKIDAAIPLLHGKGGEDGRIQGALEEAGIAYVGADVGTSAVCIDKSYTKRIVASLGIPTLDEVTFTHEKDTKEALTKCLSLLDFPMFIKPRRLGSSVGAYPVYDEADFMRLFPLSMREGKCLVTVERMLTEKRELECAFCEINKKRIITPPGEILIDGFYGYGEKYGGGTAIAPVAEIDASVARRAADYSDKIADALSLRHLSRIDFFLSGGKLIFNEVNTFPGFTSDSLYPKMLIAASINPAEALISFVEDALSC